MIRIIIFNDEYHTPICISENKDFFYGEEKLIKFLCKPHTETYVTKTLQYEYLDYDTDTDIMECFEELETKEGLNHPEFHTLFNKIWNYKGDAIYEC